MRVAIYARVSKADRHDANSIPHQLRVARQVAEDEGWNVVGEYVDEGISAYDVKKSRPEYEQMLGDLAAGLFNAPLAADLERLLRQDKEGARWLDMHGSGIARHLLFSDEASVDLDRARDRKDFKERVAAAVYYSERLSEKIRRTTRAKAAAGEWAGGGRRPFGYRVVADEDRPRRSDGRPYYKLVPDAGEARLIRAAARSVIRGSSSLLSIGRQWNDGRAPKDSGGRWTPTDVRRVLLGEQVAGMRGGVQGNWKAIVDQDTHALLNSILRDPQRIPLTEARQSRRWALAGLVSCGACGTRMNGRTTMRQLRRGGEVERRRYVCASGRGGCGRVGITAPDLERHVIAAALDRPEPVWPEEPSPAIDEVDSQVVSQLRGLQDRKRELGVAFAEGQMTPAQVAAATESLDAQIGELRRSVPPAEPRRPRTYLRTWGQFEDFMEGGADELTAEVEATNETLRWLIEDVRVAPASRSGVRFETSRVEITWRD